MHAQLHNAYALRHRTIKYVWLFCTQQGSYISNALHGLNKDSSVNNFKD